MQGILCLLYIITITSNVSGNFYQILQGKSQNFSHNNLQRSQSVRQTSDLQNDKISSSKIFEKNSIQDEIKKSHKPLNSIHNLNFLEKRYIRKKRHVEYEKKKIKSSKEERGKKINLKTNSKKKKKQSDAEFKNNKKESSLKNKYKNGNRPEQINKQTERKLKSFSPSNAVIHYLKNDQYSNTFENCRNKKDCKNSSHHRRRRKSQRIKNQRRRSRNNLRKKKSIYSQRACEAECSDRSFNSEPCHCRNEKPIDFENQLKILNKGGEEVETNKEKSGILNGIQNLLKSDVTTLNPYQCSDPINKNSLSNNNINNGITSENNFETTTKVQIFPETITESFPETTRKKNIIKFTGEMETLQKIDVKVTTQCIIQTTNNFEATTESTIKATNEVDTQINCKLLPEEIFPQTDEILSKTTNDPIVVTSNLPSGESDNKILDCEHNMENFNINEDENSFHRTETMTLVPTKEDIVDKTLLDNFYNNPCFTTPVSNNYHELCNNNNNDNEDFNNFPSNNRKYNKKPIATFSIIFKTNKMAKPKNFKFRLKY